MARKVLIAALAAALLAGTPALAQQNDVAAAQALLDQDRAPDAVALLQPLAAAGDAAAQLLLGQLYREGKGVTADPVEALRLVTAAAAQGAPEAQMELASFYFTGTGTERNLEEAARYYRLAADQNYAPAQVSLGLRYRNGEGVTADDAEALRLFNLAAEQGNAAGQYQVGLAYANARGVTQDFARAIEMMQLAADQIYVPAMYTLGVAYRAGQGVTVSAEESFRWFLTAQVIANQPAGGPIYEAVAEAAGHLSQADQDRIGYEVYDWLVAKGAIQPTPAAAPAP